VTPPNDDANGPSERELAQTRVTRLKEHDLLSGVEPFHLEDLAMRAATVSLAPGETVLTAGAANEILYFVLSGQLAVYLGKGDGPPIATIGPGQTVGEMSVILGVAAAAHVRALVASQLMAVDQSAFWHLVELSHPFSVNLLSLLARRMRETNVAHQEVEREKHEAKVAATSDALTGLHNRRWLDEMLPRFLGRHTHDGTALSVMMVDVDHFKRFNDTYGHDAGDHVLRLVARAMGGAVRPSDAVARFGGEEFTVILPLTTTEGGMVAGERLRHRVEQLDLGEHAGVKLPPVTISLGLATLRPGDDALALIKRADAALYEAKRGGRNRVHA
jgi:diguanylate cyclase (GGDEF)-like protein